MTGIHQEGDFDGACYDDYHKFYIDSIVEVFDKLYKIHCFDTKPFEKNILLGLQYPSPTALQQKFMIEVSERVNSPEWHKKMLETYKA